MAEEVKAICKVCGKSANATEFVLDSFFKKMVCPLCVRDRLAKVAAKKQPAEAAVNEQAMDISKDATGEEAGKQARMNSTGKARMDSADEGCDDSAEFTVISDETSETVQDPLSTDVPLTELQPHKAVGQDVEDKELEILHKRKMEKLRKEKENMVKAEKLDDERARYKCPKCSYEFVYNLVKQAPGKCPYCGDGVKDFVC